MVSVNFAIVVVIALAIEKLVRLEKSEYHENHVMRLTLPLPHHAKYLIFWVLYAWTS